MGSPIAPLIPKGAYYRAIRKIEEFIEPFIARAIALPESELEELSKSDMQFTFLHSIARFSKDPKTIRDQVMSALLAGRDTTAATMSWAMYEISNYPAAWARLRSEVLDVLGPNEKPTYEALKNLKYARYVLNETLRLHPAVPMNMRQALETTTIPGAPGERDIVLLKGDTVTINTLGMHARKDLYPPVTETFADPAIFSPERWESWTPKPWTYLPFHGGLRICIGQNFALTEMAYCCEYPRGHDWILPQSLVMLMSGRQWFALRSVMSGSSTAAIGRHSHYGQTSLGSRLSGCRLRCLSLCCRVTMMSESYHKRRRDTNSKTRTDNPRYARKSPLPLGRARSGPGHPRRAQHPALVVEPDALAPQQPPLLVERDALAVARPLALEAAERHARRDDAVARHARGEGVAPQRVADGARRGAQVRGQQAVGRDVAPGDAAEGGPDALLEGGAVGLRDEGELALHVVGRGDGDADGDRGGLYAGRLLCRPGGFGGWGLGRALLLALLAGGSHVVERDNPRVAVLG